jgi:hypothetical protein
MYSSLGDRDGNLFVLFVSFSKMNTSAGHLLVPVFWICIRGWYVSPTFKIETCPIALINPSIAFAFFF